MVENNAFLPYGRQHIDDDDIAAVVSVLKGDWLTTGPAVGAFERAFADFVGARYAVACNSGTAGLHLATLALGLGAGDAVVVPAVTFLATANAARYVGAEVVFADVDPETGLMRADDLEAALAGSHGDSIRAAIPVHLNGQSCDMPALAEIAERHGVILVEDACHALGACRRTVENRTAALVGDCGHGAASVFSMHPVKAITMGEGGMLTTNDASLARRLRLFRNHGITHEADQFRHSELAFDSEGAANPWYYEMAEIGFNYRASDLQCALGMSQLTKLDGFIARRRRLADILDRALAPLAPQLRPIPRVPYCYGAWHLYVVNIDFEAIGMGRGRMMRRLREMGVASQVHYMPLHLQPYYRERYGVVTLPGAETYYASCLTLPLFAAMTDDDALRVAGAVGEIIAG